MPSNLAVAVMTQDATFSKVEGVVATSVGYTGGSSSEPTYGSVCSNDGHTEAIKVDFDPSVVSYEDLLKVGYPFGSLACRSVKLLTARSQRRDAVPVKFPQNSEDIRFAGLLVRARPYQTVWEGSIQVSHMDAQSRARGSSSSSPRAVRAEEGREGKSQAG